MFFSFIPSMTLNLSSHMQFVATIYRINELTIRKDSGQRQILLLPVALIHGQVEILGALIRDPNGYSKP